MNNKIYSDNTLSIRSRAPRASSPKVRRVMQNNTGRETKPEKILRKYLRQSGFRFHSNVKPMSDLNIKADIVFKKQRLCIFIDGCFWHGCPNHFKIPNTNSSWWREKIMDNRMRDMRQTKLLRRNNWKVIRFWEHQIIPDYLEKIKQTISNKLTS